MTFLISVLPISRYANSIYYTALKMSPGVLMTWTEHNVNNQTRCGIVKYTLKSPSLDNIEDIFDYSYLQHDIKTLFAFNGKYSTSVFHLSEFVVIVFLLFLRYSVDFCEQITMLLDVAIELYQCGTIEMVIC